MTDLTSITALNGELEKGLINFRTYHDEMNQNRNYYLRSAFYQSKTGQKQSSDLRTNLLKVFADKNIFYTSPFPTIKVPPSGNDKQARESASTREKILYGVHRKSGTPLLQKKWSKDATLYSVAVAETTFDLKTRCAVVRRYDPRACFWQLSNDNEKRVSAFWAVFPITKEEAKERYGVEPTSNPISFDAFQNSSYLSAIDGRDWFIEAIRWDGKYRTAWVGDKFIEEPHEHLNDGIPIDLCMPFDDDNENNFGSFFLEPLVPLQAELNHIIKKRSAIADRMASPVVWGRGIIGRQFDEVKSNLEKQGGGFVGLKSQGELGLLQVNDVKLLNEHADDIISHMMRISGFGNASFGESVGANTSGDALGMYFTPTQRMIENQNISWVAFHESINAKILKMYDKFAKYGETFSLDGYAPGGTLKSMTDDGMLKQYQATGAYTVEFDKSVINGNYINVVVPKAITPKNEIEEKRWILDAVQANFISKTTGYEMAEMLSPEDELDLLIQEQSDPVLNPDGTAKILESQNLPQSPTPPLPTNKPELPTPVKV